MIAVKRLQSLFWVLLVALGALGAYLVSLRVATERNELMRVRTQIVQARADIRYLETEFAARSSIRQLEQWNAEDFRYSVRGVGQYLDGERALAHLDGVEPNGPVYIAPPVMVAMMDAEDANGAQASLPVASPAALQIRSDVSTIRTASAEAARSQPARAELASRISAPGAAERDAKKADKDSKAPAAGKSEAAKASGRVRLAGAEQGQSELARKAERMAMLDARLLDDRTLGDIGRKAAVEKRGGVN
ncbi:MAG: colicin transporter [Sphingobium sp.]